MNIAQLKKKTRKFRYTFIAMAIPGVNGPQFMNLCPNGDCEVTISRT